MHLSFLLIIKLFSVIINNLIIIIRNFDFT